MQQCMCVYVRMYVYNNMYVKEAVCRYLCTYVHVYVNMHVAGMEPSTSVLVLKCDYTFGSM